MPTSVSIIGSGVVGGKMGEHLSKSHDVVFYDIDGERLAELNEMGHEVTGDLGEALHGTEVSIVSVPTQTRNYRMDPGHVRDVTRDMASVLGEKGSFHVLAFKSTMVPGTTEGVVIPELEEHSGQEAHEDFGVVYTPEFLTEIAGSWVDELKNRMKKHGMEPEDMEVTPENEPRLVIGEGEDERAGDRVIELFGDDRPPTRRTDYKTAEMIKYASNAALASRISYWNDIHRLCEELGIDPEEVAMEVGRDPRIGFYGTVSGQAYGGKCLPKDTQALIGLAKERDIDLPLLEATDRVNQIMKEREGVRE